MNYFSIDIETTGLDPSQDQVLQIAVVYAAESMQNEPVERLPSMSVLVAHPRITGQAFALQMNAAILKRIADAEGVSPFAAVTTLTEFVLKYKTPGKPATAAGKNYAGFDRQFLRRMPGAEPFDALFHHRVIDAGSLYLECGDSEPPNTASCIARLLNDKPMLDPRALRLTHDALDDARLMVKLIRGRMGGRIA